jgi:hypothetical protein
MSSNAHLLAPVGMLLVVTVLWSALAGAVWWRNACILLLLGVGGYIIVQQPQPQPQQPQPAAEKVEKEKEKSQKEKEPVAAASSGADEDALSVASDGALSDVNSAIGAKIFVFFYFFIVFRCFRFGFGLCVTTLC